MPQELRPGFFLRITHISETIMSILTKLCPNVPWVILFQSYVWYVWGPKKGPRGGLKLLIILIFKNLLLVNQQCQKIDAWHITLINLENRNPVWPNDFDLQLGFCISDAFSIFQNEGLQMHRKTETTLYQSFYSFINKTQKLKVSRYYSQLNMSYSIKIQLLSD